MDRETIELLGTSACWTELLQTAFFWMMAVFIAGAAYLKTRGGDGFFATCRGVLRR